MTLHQSSLRVIATAFITCVLHFRIKVVSILAILRASSIATWPASHYCKKLKNFCLSA
ncbi:hypothetical protein RMSM_03727 [Rhodopirellula maiorica SM1]|uniref:Uncharacterized protein n=1 Tax=Rhodopirellula maiorica SM1 TaxID=1265738 RepID=M5RJ78_9BACT|nr:hypothetical protein RMSM_03727 [Rhodopirellula maiorica SM1]